MARAWDRTRRLRSASPAEVVRRLSVAVFKNVRRYEELSKAAVAGPMAANCRVLERPMKALSTELMDELATTRQKAGATKRNSAPHVGTPTSSASASLSPPWRSLASGDWPPARPLASSPLSEPMALGAIGLACPAAWRPPARLPVAPKAQRPARGSAGLATPLGLRCPSSAMKRFSSVGCLAFTSLRRTLVNSQPLTVSTIQMKSPICKTVKISLARTTSNCPTAMDRAGMKAPSNADRAKRRILKNSRGGSLLLRGWRQNARSSLKGEETSMAQLMARNMWRLPLAAGRAAAKVDRKSALDTP
mmetsp:Transcript_25625/g.76432  ORF Transcript_25625/g.76432 Transcript_25625/m.76432 type:complete len:305 (-) Transcript_25625:591-1505(-)